MEVTQEQLDIWATDFQQFAQDNLYIIDKDSNLVPFVLNRMQIKVWQTILKHLLEGKPIRILCIKDRQIGFTTLIAAIFYWICTLFPNKSSVIAAQDIDAAAGIFGKIKLFYKMSKAEMRPLRKISNRRELYFANPDEDGPLGLESRIEIDTADSAEIGVSKTIQLVLLSEFAIWESMGFNLKDRLIALKQAIPKRAGTAIIIETTPRGEGYVSNMWYDESNGYLKIFVTSVAADEYRIELDPAEYFELITYDEHKYGNEEQEYYYYKKEVEYWYSDYTPDLVNHEVMCRLAWRRGMIDDECEGDKEAFDREYPITIEKAFAAKGSQLFNQQRLKDIQNYLKEFPPTILTYRYHRGININEDDFYQSPGGNLKIFKDREEKFKYIMGCDVGQGGKGGDDSTISCRRIPDLKHIFTFRDVLPSLPFARIIFKLARYYNNAFVGVETNEKAGFAVVEYLLHTFRYLNQYQREVFLEVDVEKQKKFGWITSPHTKPTMVADYDEYLVHQDLDVLDIDIIDQASKFILFTDGSRKGKMGASTGKDDLVIADMICLQLAKYVHIAQKPEPKKYKYTFDWWASKINSDYSEYIGYNQRGPKDYGGN